MEIEADHEEAQEAQRLSHSLETPGERILFMLFVLLCGEFPPGIATGETRCPTLTSDL